jgi:hypothetical protein
MKKRITAVADKKNGLFHVIRRNDLQNAIDNLPEGRYTMLIEKQYSKRSTQQNRAIFGIAYNILRDAFQETWGEPVTIEFVHNFCKNRFLPADYIERLKTEYEHKEIVNKETGEVISTNFELTTTRMTTIEAMQYYANLQKFGAEFLNINIPDPNEND